MEPPQGTPPPDYEKSTITLTKPPFPHDQDEKKAGEQQGASAPNRTDSSSLASSSLYTITPAAAINLRGGHQRRQKHAFLSGLFFAWWKVFVTALFIILLASLLLIATFYISACGQCISGAQEGGRLAYGPFPQVLPLNSDAEPDGEQRNSPRGDKPQPRLTPKDIVKKQFPPPPLHPKFPCGGGMMPPSSIPTHLLNGGEHSFPPLPIDMGFGPMGPMFGPVPPPFPFIGSPCDGLIFPPLPIPHPPPFPPRVMELAMRNMQLQAHMSMLPPMPISSSPHHQQNILIMKGGPTDGAEWASVVGEGEPFSSLGFPFPPIPPLLAPLPSLSPIQSQQQQQQWNSLFNPTSPREQPAARGQRAFAESGKTKNGKRAKATQPSGAEEEAEQVLETKSRRNRRIRLKHLKRLRLAEKGKNANSNDNNAGKGNSNNRSE